MIFAIVSPDMISWNATRTRVNGLSEPRDLVDGLIKELGLSLDERAALDRQAKLFEKHAGGGYAVSRHSEISALFENVGKMQPSPQPEDGNEERVDNVESCSRFIVLAASNASLQTANGMSSIALEMACIGWRILPSVEQSTTQKISWQ